MKNNLTYILLLFLSFCSLHLGAQITSANQVYEVAQAERHKANLKWNREGATMDDISEAITILKNTLIYLDSNLIFDLAEGNRYLAGRQHDIYFDMANAYAIAGQDDSAISYLEKMFDSGSSSGMFSFIQNDSIFITLKSDPRFIALSNKFKNQGDLYRGTAFKTPYKPELTEDEKISGLSLLWSQAKYNFVYFDRVNIDWNQSYLDYLPKVRAARNTTEYYKILQTFYVQLKDGHTNVYPPKELTTEFYSRPPMRTELIQGKVFIKVVLSDSLKKEGVVPGLEVLKIDNQPVIEFANKYVAPYQSSSTTQDMEIREYSYALLAGPADKSVSLELKDGTGKVFIKTIFRTGYKDIKGAPPMEYQTIGNVGYLTINSFEDPKIAKQFDSLFVLLSQTKALIIDIRNNGGGNSSIGIHILRKLTNKPFTNMNVQNLKYLSVNGMEKSWYREPVDIIEPDGKSYYSKPIVLLVGARTFSAAEDFAAQFKYMQRGKLIGQLTGGSTGQPITFDLPGGGSARVCARRETYPDGKEFVGIGIVPDITIIPTIEDLQNSKDSVKDKALELLDVSY